MSDDIAQASTYIKSATLGPIQVGRYPRAQVLEKVGDRGNILGEAVEFRFTVFGPVILSLLPNLTRQNLADVINSVEFASRIATEEVGANDHTEAYWEAFKKSILQIGWFKQQEQWSKDFVDGQTTGAETFGDYVIENVRNDPLYSSAEKDGILNALDTIRTNPDYLGRFRKSTAGGNKGSYSVNAAAVDNDTLTLRFSAFTFNCNAVVEDYLASSTKDIKADIGKDNVGLVANQRVIDAVRKQVEEELSKVARKFLEDLDI